MTEPVRIGVPCAVDSAPVIVAAVDGLFAEQDVPVALTVERDWTALLDRLAAGALEAAVMPPPLALAARAGLHRPPVRLLVPLTLSQGGNVVLVRRNAAAALLGPAAPTGVRLPEWLRAQARPPRFAVEHAFSTQNILLRYWLASAGVDPDRNVETVAMTAQAADRALAGGDVVGCCAGAAWGALAARRGIGRVLAGTQAVWPFHPEKCLCVGQAWAEENPGALDRLLRALLRAQRHCDRPEAAAGVADKLVAACPGFGLPFEAIRAALPGGDGGDVVRFHAGAACFPARAHAAWFLGQMERWGWTRQAGDASATAAAAYRPDLLNAAFAAEGSYPLAGLPALEATALLPTPEEAAFTPA